LEEVLHVIYCINRVLSVVAISALHSIQNNSKVIDNDMDILNRNKTSQEKVLDDQIIVENKFPPDSSQQNVLMFNGEVVEMNGDEETTKDKDLMSIDDVQRPELLENVEKMETQEDNQDRESKYKDKGRYILSSDYFKIRYDNYFHVFFVTETILPLPYAAKVSICMVILMYLKEHLKKAYALSEV